MRRVHGLVRLGAIVLSAWGASAGCTGEGPDFASAPPPGANPDAGPPVVQPDSSAPGADTGDACPAGQQRCEEKCVLTSTDRDHCGACGHDCAGGDCKDGVCQPVIIAPSVHLPLGVTAAGNAVFWSREGSDTSVVESCPKSGCVPPIKEIASSVGRAFTADIPTGATILSNGVHVQWIGKSPEPGVENSVVYTCPVTGCDGSPDYVANPSSISQLGRTGDTLYFRNDGGQLSFCPFGTCASANVKSAGTGDNGSIGLAVSANRVYFDDAFDGSVSSCPVGVENCTRSTPYFKTSGKLNLLATAGTKIVAVVTNGGTTSIVACEAEGGTTCAGQPAILASSNLSPVSAVVGDADSVYFALSGTIGAATGEIRRCKLPDCAGGSVAVVKNLGLPSSLWLDDGVLFWAARGTPPAPSSGSIGKIRP